MVFWGRLRGVCWSFWAIVGGQGQLLGELLAALEERGGSGAPAWALGGALSAACLSFLGQP